MHAKRLARPSACIVGGVSLMIVAAACGDRATDDAIVTSVATSPSTVVNVAESSTTTAPPSTSVPTTTAPTTTTASTRAATDICARVEAGLIDGGLPLDADYEIYNGPLVTAEFGHDLLLYWSPSFDHFAFVVIDADGRIVLDTLVNDVSALGAVETDELGWWGPSGDPDADCSSSSTQRTAPPNDAEPGLQFDIGALTDVFHVDGVMYIEFDRFQVVLDERGPISALEFVNEPIMAGYTDWPFTNENPRLRYFPVADAAEVLAIDPSWVEGQNHCGDGSRSDDPVAYDAVDPERLIGENAPVALTFDSTGTVTRIRDVNGC